MVTDKTKSLTRLKTINFLVNLSKRYSSYFGKVKTYVDSTCYVEAVSVYFMLGNKF